MNKNRILFILIIGFITMFGFKLDVYAAKELTCIYNYNKDGINKKIILQQKQDGGVAAYSSGSDVNPNDSPTEWAKLNVSYYFNSSVKNGSGQLDKCPSNVEYKKHTDEHGSTEELWFVNDCTSGQNCSALANQQDSVIKVGEEAKKSSSDSKTNTKPKIGDFDSIDDYKKVNFVDNDLIMCENGKFLGDAKLSDLLHTIVIFIKILVPVLLLVFGSMDLVQAIFAQDESAIKKAQGKFIKRLIIAVIIFLIPTFLKVILDIANSVWNTIDSSLCGIL